ncbi:helix-turn-helix domain-containing protein [Companilactobacillus futsaii]|uniref:Helix-turn-helix transcriptional regulator n=1 Tax=Companilactobacillus futsaii TaxID=938155 RepID=A0A5B7T6B3_9LACO|nr:helix-turn-helix transcriptional regulator [Companilactobacillus futsaii]QCX25751.1 helix-turn-helix transcriptional regulator [Companilactobacillus futsaii]
MNNLSAILGRRLLTIGNVADGTGLNRNTISSIYHRKTNNINLKTLIRICDYLQIPLSELIEYIPDKNK